MQFCIPVSCFIHCWVFERQCQTNTQRKNAALCSALISGVNLLQLHFSGGCFEPVQCEKGKLLWHIIYNTFLHLNCLENMFENSLQIHNTTTCLLFVWNLITARSLMSHKRSKWFTKNDALQLHRRASCINIWTFAHKHTIHRLMAMWG